MAFFSLYVLLDVWIMYKILGGNILMYLAISIFIFSWVLQFFGHKIEGKKPSFIKDVQFLLIGPAWLLGYIYKKIGIKF